MAIQQRWIRHVRRLLGRVGGKFYGDLLQDRIFKPLGMDTARIISESDISSESLIWIYVADGKLVIMNGSRRDLNTTADGSLHLTLRDYVKWDQALYTENC